MSIQSVVGASGILLGLLLLVAVLARRDTNRAANRYLAAALACSLGYLVALELLLNQWLTGPAVAALAGLYILSTPLLYGYTRALTQPGFTLRVRDGLHLLPFLFLMMAILFGSGGEDRYDAASLAAARGGWPPSNMALMSIPFYGIQVFYLAGALAVTRSHRSRIGDEFSYRESITLRWLSALLLFHLLFSAGGLLIAIARFLPGVELWPRSIYSMSMVVAIYYLIAFMGVMQPAIFSGAAGSDRPGAGPGKSQPEFAAAQDDGPGPDLQAESTQARYETSALTATAAETYWSQLTQLMLEEKPFLDHTLRIARLAEQSGIPEHYLSQTINQHAGLNFFEFVNQFRLEEAKKLLQQSDCGIAQAAQQSGFNSQSAFYRYFRKSTGMTPKQYRLRVGIPTPSDV